MKPLSSQTQPGLYIVATPIGNLGDITLRALETLKAADVIVCEDTRVTGKLLSHFGILKPTWSYNDHNARSRRPRILEALEEGKRVALVSDAGTPLISDPGYKLVREALAAGYYVTTLPGASSVMAALCLAGLPTDRFFFAGFLPAKATACKKTIAELKTVPATLVMFESARRLPHTLKLLAEELGVREAAVVREITKLFEETRRAPLAGLAAHYEKEGEPKGEVVIVIAPPQEEAPPAAELDALLQRLLKTHSLKEAVAVAAEQTGLARKDVYARALAVSKHD